MFTTIRTFTVKAGFSKEIIEKFSQPGILEEQTGFIKTTLLKKKVRRNETEEVLMLTEWESEADWKAWQKSDAHVQGHKLRGKQKQADFILDVDNSRYTREYETE